MKARWLLFSVVLILSLAAGPVALADSQNHSPTWQKVFDPVAIFGGDWHWPYLVKFHNQLIAGPFYSSPEDVGQLWASEDGENWHLAWSASDIQEGGHYINSSPYVFKNRLYLQVHVCFNENDCEARIVRTRDDRSWETVFVSSIEETGYIYRFGTLGGYLYIYSFDLDVSPMVTHLLRSASGNPGTWQEVAQFPGWDSMGSYVTFKGRFYLMSNYIHDADGNNLPAQVWSSADGVNWEPVILDGFGDPTNILGGALGEHKGYLYAGVGDSPTAGDIYRTKNGVDWEPVTLDGFGDPNNMVAFSFVSYRGLLYTFYSSWSGLRVYASHDGVQWMPVSEPGWGEPGNLGIVRESGRVIFKGDLYAISVGWGGLFKLVNP